MYILYSRIWKAMMEAVEAGAIPLFKNVVNWRLTKFLGGI